MPTPLFRGPLSFFFPTYLFHNLSFHLFPFQVFGFFLFPSSLMFYNLICSFSVIFFFPLSVPSSLSLQTLQFITISSLYPSLIYLWSIFSFLSSSSFISIPFFSLPNPLATYHLPFLSFPSPSRSSLRLLPAHTPAPPRRAPSPLSPTPRSCEEWGPRVEGP